MVSAVFGGPTSILVLLMVLHGPIATNILNVYSAALAALSAGFNFSRTVLATVVGVAGCIVTLYFIFAPSFAKAFDNWLISLLLWMSPWAGVVLRLYIKVRARSRSGAVPLPRKRAPMATSTGPASSPFLGSRRGMVGGRWPGGCAAGTDLDQSFGWRGSKLAIRDRRRRRCLSCAQQARYGDLVDRRHQRAQLGDRWITACRRRPAMCRGARGLGG